jgi:hypothetical protein
MVAMSNLGIPQRAAREQIASAIDVVIQVSRLSDGRRRLLSLQEVTGMEGDVVTMQEIFTFERRGIDGNGNVLGSIEATGLRPSFAEKVRLAGIEPQHPSLGGPPRGQALRTLALYIRRAARARGRVRAAVRAPDPARVRKRLHAIAQRVARSKRRRRTNRCCAGARASGFGAWPVSRLLYRAGGR